MAKHLTYRYSFAQHTSVYQFIKKLNNIISQHTIFLQNVFLKRGTSVYLAVQFKFFGTGNVNHIELANG